MSCCQVLDSLDDQLDDLETQLSYIDGEVADRRSALEQLQQRRSQLEDAGQRYGAPALRAALGVALEAVGQRAAQVGTSAVSVQWGTGPPAWPLL